MARPALRTILFRLHWALGLSAGLVLAAMGASGALLSYEDAVMAWADAAYARAAPGERAPLPPEALVARLAAQRPDLRVAGLTLSADPAASVRVRIAPPRPGEARPPSLYLDPGDGRVLGEARFEGVFATVRSFHRFLLLPGDGKGWGRPVTGFCTLALLVFLGTGLYLRWPQRHGWRVWLRPSLARPGRPRWWSLHAVLGTWLAPAYLVMLLSGLWWSYDWYRTGATWLLTGSGPEARTRTGRVPETPALDAAWAAFRAGEGRAMASATLNLPGGEGGPTRIRWLEPGDPPKVRNEASFDPATGAPLAVTRHAERSLGQQMAGAMLEVHRGRFFGPVVALLFCLAALLMPVFAATGLVLYAGRRRSRRRRTRAGSRGVPAVARARGIRGRAQRLIPGGARRHAVAWADALRSRPGARGGPDGAEKRARLKRPRVANPT